MKLNLIFIAALSFASASALMADSQIIPLDSGWALPPGGKIIQQDGKPVLEVSVAPGEEIGKQELAKRPFDLAPFRGHCIAFVYEARAIKVSQPSEVWNGLKLMLHYKSGDRELWPNTPKNKRFGNYDWTSITVQVYVQPDAKDGELTLGLQNSSGAMQVRSATLRDLGLREKDPFAAPAPIPAGFKAQYTDRVSALPRLRGAMSPNSYKKEDLEAFAKWKGNLIRWQLKRNWDKINADRDIPEFRQWLDGKLAELEQVAADCEKLGIKIAVDMHGAPGAHNAEDDLAMLYEKEFADAYVDCWRQIAVRFKGNPAVWAYDLINEPKQSESGLAEENYLEIQFRAAEAIREIDPEIPVIVAANFANAPEAFSYLHPLPLKNVIYEVHMYAPGVFTHQGIFNTSKPIAYPGLIQGEEWNRERIKKELVPVRDFQLKYGARIYCGEFSAVRYAPGAAKYLEDVISVLEEYGWDWTYHAFRESPYWSVECSEETGDASPAKTQTKRCKVLLRAFEKNENLK